MIIIIRWTRRLDWKGEINCWTQEVGNQDTRVLMSLNVSTRSRGGKKKYRQSGTSDKR